MMQPLTFLPPLRYVIYGWFIMLLAQASTEGIQIPDTEGIPLSALRLAETSSSRPYTTATKWSEKKSRNHLVTRQKVP